MAFAETFKALSGWGGQFDFAAYAEGEDELSRTTCAVASVALAPRVLSRALIRRRSDHCRPCNDGLSHRGHDARQLHRNHRRR